MPALKVDQDEATPRPRPEARQRLPRRRSKLWKAAIEASITLWRFSLFHRRKRKGRFRGVWIVRINAPAATWRLILPAHRRDGETRHDIDREDLRLAISDPRLQEVAQAAGVAS